MSNLVFLSENPTFIVIITICALLFLFLGFVGLNLLVKVNRLEASLKTVISSSADTADDLIRFSLRWDEWTKSFEKLDARNSQTLSVMEQMRSDQEFLTKAFGNESKLSKAIELARAGLTADEITLQAGVSADEAAVIVKFHAPK